MDTQQRKVVEIHSSKRRRREGRRQTLHGLCKFPFITGLRNWEYKRYFERGVRFVSRNAVWSFRKESMCDFVWIINVQCTSGEPRKGGGTCTIAPVSLLSVRERE